MSTLNANNYAKNAAILKSHADRLKRGGPADVDTLVETFREAREAYSACRDRLMAIRDEIEAEDNGGSSGGAPAHARDNDREGPSCSSRLVGFLVSRAMDP